MTRAEITPVIGKLNTNGYPQVIKNNQGNLVFCYSIFGDNAQQMGQDFAKVINNLNSESALELNKVLKSLLEIATKADCQLQMACGLFLDNKIIFASFNGKILLKRNNQIGNILTTEEELKMVEGEYQDGDMVILATKQSYSYLEEIKQKLYQGLSVSTIINDLIPSLHGQEDSSLSSLVFIAPILDDKMTGIQEDKKEEGSEEKVKKEKETVASKVIVEDLKPKKKINFKLIGLIFFILIILGSVGGYYYINTQKAEQEKLALIQKIYPIQNLLLEAESIKSSDPINAREKTMEAINQLNGLTSQYQKNKTLSTLIQDEISKAETFNQTISGKEEVGELPLFFDLKLVNSDFIATTADTDGENIYFLDTNNNQVIRLNLEKKQSQILPIGNQQTLTDLAVGEKYLYLLGEGLLKYDKAGEFPAVEISDQETFNTKQNQMLANFGPFLYVFNSDEKNIYKVDSEENSEIKSWFESENGLDFDQVKSIVIDGDIWLTTKTGEIKKFTQGLEQKFDITGLDDQFDSPTTIYTKDNLENLYILEPKKQRVVVLTKKGEFLREIKSHSLANTTSLVVSEELNKIYALNNSIIYEINL